MKVLDLFSGIGAYALGVERAGMQVVAFCEVEEFPRLVLRKHWPDVPIYEDVRTLTADVLERDGIDVDVIIGGFPCQDLSSANSGKPRAGLDGDRSGLWSEMRRLIGELRPRYVIVENSDALLNLDRGANAGRLFGDLAALGYSAEWHVMGAVHFGAPHERERVWIVAYPDHEGEHVCAFNAEVATPSQFDPYAHGFPAIGPAISRTQLHPWADEPGVDRVAYGLADRMDRNHTLGNCNPPIIPETIARAVIAHAAGVDLKAALPSRDDVQER